MFSGLDRNERLVLAGAAIVLLATGYGLGTMLADSGTRPTGNVAASPDVVSPDTIRQTVQEVMDRQLQRQRTRLQAAANRSENLSMDDLAINAEVRSVEESRFADLYKVNVTVQGAVPAMLGGGTREVRQTQLLYISKDGRFLFRQPTDLAQPRRASPGRGRPTGP